MYIGTHSVKDTQDLGDFLLVSYHPEKVGEKDIEVKSEVFNKDLYNKVATEEVGTLTKVRDIKINNATAEILGILVKYNFKLAEISPLVQSVVGQLEDAKIRAFEKLFEHTEDTLDIYTLEKILNVEIDN